MPDPTLARVAVVGLGRWGKVLIDAFSQMAEVVACCNRSNEADRAWVSRHHPEIDVVPDVQHLLDDARVGTIVVATPTWTHADLASRALDAGKHVFVEKPLATSSTEAGRLVARAHEAGRSLFVDHTYLFEPALEALLEAVRSDPVEHATLRWEKLGTFGEDLHWNLLAHDAAIGLALFGQMPFESVVLERRGVLTETDVLACRFGFDSGPCFVSIDRCMPRPSKTVRVLTRSGRVLLWQQGGLWELGPDRAFDQIFSTSTPPLTRAVGCFLDGSASRHDDGLAARVVEVVEQVAAYVPGLDRGLGRGRG